MIAHDTEKLSSQKAIVKYAQDLKMINMAVNGSAENCPIELEQLLNKYVLPYANVSSQKFGLEELRSEISKKVSHFYDYNYNPETEISVSPGVKQSVFATIFALLKEGDEVVIFEPSHKNYELAINLTGARAVFVNLKVPDFHIDWEEVQKLINGRTRMIIINNPHFPTGYTLSELDMIRLQKIINGTNIYILSDETFEHLIFDNGMHQSIALYPKLRERSVLVSCFNETFHIPNWHIGYCMAPAKIMNQIRKVISIFGEGISTPFQMAVAEYMHNKKDYKEIAKIYQHKRDLFLNIIEGSSFQAIPSKSTYYQLISRNENNDIHLCMNLLNNYQIATVPLSYYFHQKTKSKHIRVNLSLPDDVIEKVALQLKNI